MFKGQTDPYPYLLAAYGIGFLVLVLFFIWLVKSEKSLKSLESLFEPEEKK